ncbi:hypothetical protein [Haloglomus salinum]|uniref:hypothetical protein n=1 Tax=Haloglomus salinum TaxID=2962673 RepID=UPI0020CA214D|nr:hypothetical protein [Haloglomus salinum]
MDLDDSLRDSIYTHIDQITQWSLSSFDREVDVIDKTVDTLDGFEDSNGGQSAKFKTKKMHPSPKVDFSGPRWSGNKANADWIDRKNAELADLMFVANRLRGNTVVSRRVMISQTKFTRGASKKWKWKVRMHQFHLLDSLPEIEFVEPATGERFDIDPDNRSFTTYSFASDHYFPFFNTTAKMQEFMSSTQGVKSTTFDPTPDAPHGFQVFRGMLKRFVLGMYGERFSADDTVGEMIQHMYDNATFDQGSSPNTLTDGGQTEMNDPATAVVQIDLGLENQEANFDELDSDGPRL